MKLTEIGWKNRREEKGGVIITSSYIREARAAIKKSDEQETGIYLILSYKDFQ